MIWRSRRWPDTLHNTACSWGFALAVSIAHLVNSLKYNVEFRIPLS